MKRKTKQQPIIPPPEPKKPHPVLYRRPSRIGFRVYDPFDNFQLFWTMGPFDAALNAMGHYRREREFCIEVGKMTANSLYRRGYRPPLRLRQPKVQLLIQL